MEGEIRLYSEMQMPEKGERFEVKVPYQNNGQSRYYTCSIHLNGGLRLAVKMPPEGFSIDGVFVDGDDEPEVGVCIRRKMLRERNVFVGGSKSAIVYGRVLNSAPKTQGELRSAVSGFVGDVAMTVPEVNRLVLEYLATKRLGEDLKKYSRSESSD